MNLNRLYAQHQVSLIEASEANTPSDRGECLTKADEVAIRIRAIQSAKDVNAVDLLPAGQI